MNSALDFQLAQISVVVANVWAALLWTFGLLLLIFFAREFVKLVRSEPFLRQRERRRIRKASLR